MKTALPHIFWKTA